MQATAEPMAVVGWGLDLTEAQAREIYRQGEEAVVFVLLQQAKRLAEARLTGRLQDLIATAWDHPEARRLLKRLRRHQDELFTFLDYPGVPFENNHAERAIRPAVIIRKNSQCNRSQRGAQTQTILMSVYRTLKQRGHPPIDTMTLAIRTYLSTPQLPPLPSKTAPSG